MTLESLIPKNIRLRRGGLRSTPVYVRADGHTPGEHVIDKGDKRFMVKIYEEPRHGTAPGDTSMVMMAKIHRIA